MRKIVLAGMIEETCDFSSMISTEERFDTPASCEGEELLLKNRGGATALSGMIDVIDKRGDMIIPSLFKCAFSSGGPVERGIAEDFAKRVVATVHENQPVDAIFLSMHGGMTLTEEDDGSGLIYDIIRRNIGDNIVIATSNDMHANITRQNLQMVNIVSGFQTFPHVDFYNTGKRAAELAYRVLDNKKTVQSCIRVPMIVPAESYDTDIGLFADLINEAHAEVKSKKILDFSIFMMQPWLNLKDAGSSIIITAEDQATADAKAIYYANKLYSLRHELTVKIYPIEEVVDIAYHNDTEKPIILIDSADSSNAGATADSSFVLEYLVTHGFDKKTALCIADPGTVETAFQIGVGKTGKFMIGGYFDHVFQKPFETTAYVKSLHDGKYELSFTRKGELVQAGKTAVLSINNIDIVVFTRMCVSSDPQLYRAFGIEPANYRLVQVKSATQFKQCYLPFSDLFYLTDTPGASSANLKSLPFDKLPHPFWPFEDEEDFDHTIIHAGN